MDQNPSPPEPTPEPGEGAPASAGEFVTIPRAELEVLLSRLDAVRPAPGAPASVAGREPGLESELAARDRRVSDLEHACRAAIRDRELATALAGRPLVPGAVAQLLKLWRDELDVYEEDGAYKVAARDGRAVAQAVGEWLASPDFSHFSLPTSRGGTGARGANRPAPGVEPAAPKNLGEAIVMKWREAAAARTDNLLKPIGLRRHR